MKIIKGFENEDIIISDFGEWVGKDYIDYKAEYKNNQKIIKRLLDENKQLKDNWNKLKEWLEKELGDRINPNKDKWLTGVYDAYKETIDKMQELESSDSDENNK